MMCCCLRLTKPSRDSERCSAVPLVVDLMLHAISVSFGDCIIGSAADLFGKERAVMVLLRPFFPIRQQLTGLALRLIKGNVRIAAEPVREGVARQADPASHRRCKPDGAHTDGQASRRVFGPIYLQSLASAAGTTRCTALGTVVL